MIDGNNFFMLRDIASVLNGTTAQFEVAWDGARNAINLIPGESYTRVGGEMATGGVLPVRAVASNATVLVDGEPVNLRAYNIGGNNFFMLRDLGEALGFDGLGRGNRKCADNYTSRTYTGYARTHR